MRVGLDRYSGAVLARQILLYGPDINSRVHFRSIGGHVLRALYAASCFIGAALLPTGVLIWWFRR